MDRFVDFVTIQKGADSWTFPVNKWVSKKTGESGRSILSIDQCIRDFDFEPFDGASDLDTMDFQKMEPGVPVKGAPSASVTGIAEMDEMDDMSLDGALLATPVKGYEEPTTTAPCTESAVPVETTPCTESAVPVETTPCTESAVPVETTPCTESAVPVETTPCTESAVPVETTPCTESAVPVETTPVPTPSPMTGYGAVLPPPYVEETETPEVSFPDHIIETPIPTTVPEYVPGYAPQGIPTPFPEVPVTPTEAEEFPEFPDSGYAKDIPTPMPPVGLPDVFPETPLPTPVPTSTRRKCRRKTTAIATPVPTPLKGYGRVPSVLPSDSDDAEVDADADDLKDLPKDTEDKELDAFEEYKLPYAEDDQ